MEFLKEDPEHRMLATNVTISTDTWKWIYTISGKYELKNGQWELKSEDTVSNTSAGHADKSINSSSGGFILSSLILLILSTLYMMYRVYYKKKYFSKDWLRAHGEEVPGEENDKEENNLHTEKEMIQKSQKKKNDLSISKQSSS